MVDQPRPPMRRYAGQITDNDIWDRFRIRPGDIFVCTPPKCGTTWMQTILRMMATGRADPSVYDNRVSPWLDAGFRDRDAQAEILQAQSERRVIKTHTPIDGITFDPKATYIAVYRHPIDAHLSFRTHAENMTVDMLGFMFPEDVGDGVRRFIRHADTSHGTDDLNLASFVAHYNGFRDAARHENVHLFHYADLSRDLAGEVARLAGLIGLDLPQKAIREIADAAGFSSMRAHAESLTRAPGFETAFKDPAKFFADGTSRKWVGRVSDADLRAYEDRMDALVSPRDRAWLEGGNRAHGPGA
ncbi:MAG: sulfotransferase domain-containing protein [Pseudomonadota bacterium]